MKCTIPEISWHNRDPVLSVDIQPNSNSQQKNNFYRLASGGTDTHVLIWYMILNDETSIINLELAADLTRHQRAVNAVKWSPNGQFLASADDESIIMIWKLKEESEPVNILDSTNEQDKEIWVTHKILRGHMEDVYDLSWSMNSLFLVSGSVDNSAMIWDINKGSIGILNDHKGFVQGVSWDPKNQYIATLSTDRHLRIFDVQSKKVVNRIFKCALPVPESDEIYGKTVRIFHDDTLQTFYRRLTFSPDGNLLITPSGTGDCDGVVKPMHFTYIFSRHSLKQPAIILPSVDGYTVAVKFSPLLYKLRLHSETSQPVIPLPYRMIFAVATKSSVYLYDTQQKVPFALISNIHYTRITDITWSDDGRILIVSSTDGFCSLITFSKNEIGEVYDEINMSSTLDMGKFNPSNTTEKRNDKENKLNTNQIPQPIEIRRKPRQTNKDVQITEPIAKQNLSESLLQSLNLTENKKTKNQSETIQKCDASTTLKDETENDQKHQSSSSLNLNDIIVLNKDIISSDDKFESPAKKTQAVTPISIRRHPRIHPHSSSKCQGHSIKDDPLTKNEAEFLKTTDLTPKNMPDANKNMNFGSKSKPRALMIALNEKKCVLTDEIAMDAWPMPLETVSNDLKNNTQEKIVLEKVKNNILEEVNNSTSDIRLFYEDTTEESFNETASEISSSMQKVTDELRTKTPRRVPFKTISTPKSNKTSTIVKRIDDIETVVAEKKTNEETKEIKISNDFQYFCQVSPDTKNGSLNSMNVDESPLSQNEQKSLKTPRRVPFKTISTPKSHKSGKP